MIMVYVTSYAPQNGIGNYSGPPVNPKRQVVASTPGAEQALARVAGFGVESLILSLNKPYIMLV